MARLAWLTPLPPSTSGIAQYSVELLPRLAPAHEIDVFVNVRPGRPGRPGPPDRAAGLAPGQTVWSAHDFVWKHLQQPYDLVVYQLGNATCHDYMWGYLARYPGLVALHDGQLHHARARCLLRQRRDDDYRAEFRFNHPRARAGVAELGVAGLLGSLTYLWPMVRTVVESARLTVVHNRWLADQLQDASPDAAIRVVEMGVPPAGRGDGAGSVRARHGIPPGATLFAAFGRVTPEKRLAPVIRALASVAADVPDVHLLLAGEPAEYFDAIELARASGIADKVTVAGFVPEEELADYLAAADVCLCLRWPSSRETSASWLRCLAAGRPTVITDLAQTIDVPGLDPRSWKLRFVPRRASEGGAGAAPAGPACVGIDILDEDHSLRLALRRLATDPRLRETLGSNARRLWAERFTLDRMASGYHDAIAAACAVPVPDLTSRRARLPRHLLADGSEHAARLLRETGLPESRIGEVWLSATSGSG